MQNIWKRISFVLASMLVGSLVTMTVMSTPQSGPAQDATMRRGSDTADNLSAAFRGVAESMRPSVVSISTRAVQVVPARLRGLPPGFEGIFGGPMRPQRRESEGMGSGVIVRSDGYILTNNHVIEGVDELTVEFADGEIVPGQVVGSDPQTDLAVIKVDRRGLRAVPLGNSDRIQVGDWVLAIGSPFGLDQTVTAGIISGKNRVQGILDDGQGLEDFLQTDAAINPGNSGGPLVDLRGELIGINTAILSRSGGSAGIGFAIPMSMVRPVFESILETGEVQRGFLGAAVDDITPRMVRDFDLDVRSGGLVVSVLDDQPAAKAGLQPGDVVIEFDGRQARTGKQIRSYVASRRPGTVVEMLVNRGGREFKVAVTLGERSSQLMAMYRETSRTFGAVFLPVTPEFAREYGYKNLKDGLIVVRIEDGSLAEEAELQVGDVLISAAGLRLTSEKQLERIFEAGRETGRPIRMVVRRGNEEFMVLFR